MDCRIQSMPAEVIRDLFAAIDARDWDDLPRHFTSDIVYERPGYSPIRSLAELCDFYRNVRIVLVGQHALEHIVADEHRAAAWGRFQGRARDGLALDERFADAYEFRNGLICLRRTYFYRAAI